MATSSNALKVASVFRGRLKMIQELTEVYKPPITRNKEKLMELIKEKTERVTKSELARKLKDIKGFYVLEMAPPTTAKEIRKLSSDIKLAQDLYSTGAYKHLTVKQAWLLFLVGLEISLWFFLGETVGKFHIVGYSV